MSESTARSLVCAACGALCLRLTITGESALYVTPVLMPLLSIAGVLLIVVAALSWLGNLRSSHRHSHGTSKVLGLVIVPILAVAAIGPAPLTSAITVRPTARPIAARSASNSVTGSASDSLAASDSGFSSSLWIQGGSPNAPTVASDLGQDPVYVDPKTGRTLGGYAGVYGTQKSATGSSHAIPVDPPKDQYSALTGDPAKVDVYDYVDRASNAAGAATLEGHRISIVGFVSTDPDNPSGPWVLTRLKMWCCVADALPFMISIDNAPKDTPRGEWVRVTGTALPTDQIGNAHFKAEKIDVIKAPKDPYLW